MGAPATGPTSTSVARGVRRVLVALLVVAILVLGVWITGGIITDDFETSVALTTAWFAVAGVACAATAYSRRGLRIPVLAAYFVTAVAVGGYLGWTTLHDRVVHEQVAVGIPASRVAGAPGRDDVAVTSGRVGAAAKPERARRAAAVQLAAGRFRSGEHETTGRAAIVRLPGGRLVLTITRFRTSPGPDLRVRLVPGNTDLGDVTGNRDLGGLKGNVGDQQYDLPERAPVGDASVIIWCRAFTATFGAAHLAPS
jgi:hypothetical protein